MANTFQSFVKFDGKPSSPPPDGMVCVSRKLLPGEIECTSCDDVTFNLQFQEPLPGKLTCTNFCLFFQPFIVSPSFQRVPRRFSVLDEQYTIPLCSIETIYYTVLQTDLAPSPKELRELVAPLSSMEPVSYVKLFLKDFRVATIDMSRTQHAPNLVNQLLCFSKQSSVEHIVQSGNVDWMTRREFNDEESWRNELKRVCAGQQWRICSVRKELRHTPTSYPMYVVVPQEITCHELDQLVEHFSGGRFPIWVWSCPTTGTPLLRSSTHDDFWIPKQIVEKYGKYLTAHTPNKEHHLLKIGDAYSTFAIRTAYKRLRKLCSIDSHELYNSRERDWFTRVHDTGWTQLVYHYLRSAGVILKWMVDQGSAVTITETDGLDASAVVSSLVQICAESENRTTAGMERLINKEWIALGHPFGQRICGLNKNPATPTFLLFLDCVAQLRRLYPTQFGFSDHFLISLWDISLTGCIAAFACSSIQDQLASDRGGGPFPLSRFFTEDYRSLFPNSLNDTAQFLQRTSRSPMRSRIQVDPVVPLLCDVIRPPTLPVDIELWDMCYLRWIPRANSLNGGELISEMVLDDIMESLSQQAGLYWKKQHSGRDILPNTLSPSYPYSLPLTKPYITYNLSDQMDSLSINSTITFNQNIKETKKGSRANSLTIQEPIPAPRRPVRKAPPPPPPKKISSDSTYRTHF